MMMRLFYSFIVLTHMLVSKVSSVFTDQYFRDNGITLTERFSAPQKGGYSEEEAEELTLDERFSSNRCVGYLWLY